MTCCNLLTERNFYGSKKTEHLPEPEFLHTWLIPSMSNDALRLALPPEVPKSLCKFDALS